MSISETPVLCSSTFGPYLAETINQAIELFLCSKKGNLLELSNCRSINLLTPILKGCERILCRRTQFFKKMGFSFPINLDSVRRKSCK